LEKKVQLGEIYLKKIGKNAVKHDLLSSSGADFSRNKPDFSCVMAD
jgi:hypothetical protein